MRSYDYLYAVLEKNTTYNQYHSIKRNINLILEDQSSRLLRVKSKLDIDVFVSSSPKKKLSITNKIFNRIKSLFK